ncbi:MAG TPA: acyltransferase [Candidatus Limnocylindrales bacterium]|nr:acyltransferase [Candidatus Limnocylindrales bacterium]
MDNATGRSAGLDGVRGLAVLLVALGHVSLVPSGGWIGMSVFFALSGYLITGILLRERAATGTIRIRAFYRRRIARLVPALALLLAVVALTGTASAVSWWSSVAYVKNWQMAIGHTIDPLAHVWSLGIEEQFYLAWPLLLVGLRLRRGLVIVLALAVAVTLLRFQVDADRAYYGTETRGDALLLGSAAAIAVRLGWRAPRWLGWAGLAAVLGLALLPDGSVPWLTWGLALGSLASVALVAGGAPGVRWLAPLGLISYGVYLWHWPIVWALGGIHQPPLVGLATIVAACLVATASFVFLERPASAVLRGRVRLVVRGRQLVVEERLDPVIADRVAV